MSVIYGTTGTEQAYRPTRVIAGHGLGTLRPAGLLATIAVVLVFIGFSALLMIAPEKPETILALGVGAICVMVIMRWPVTGTYAAVIMTVLFDALPASYVHTPFSEVGIFRNLSNRGLPNAVVISLFEIVILLSLVSAFTYRFNKHQKLAHGPLFGLMIALGGVVLFGEFNGILSGGDFKISLWEVRALLYSVAVYVLAVNTITEPKHIRAVLWITGVCIGIRSLDGIYRFFAMPGDLRAIVEVVLEHDDSLFEVIAFALVIAAIAWRKWLPKHFVWMAIAITPLATYMMLINGRRAAFYCLALSFIAIAGMLWVAARSRMQRRKLIRGVFMVLLVAAGYIAVFWNVDSGLGKPAQSLRSVIQPDQRDFASNLYRVQEDINLRYTISLSPITGIGFGRPFSVVQKMVDLSDKWSLQLYMPHNNILWLWMRMGVIGFIIFWMMIGSVVLLVAATLRLAVGRLKLLLVEERKHRPNEQKVRRGLVKGVSAEGATRHIVLFTPRDNVPWSGMPEPEEVARNPYRLIRKELLECVELLVLVVLAMTVIISWVALAATDQGLMSFRLAAYVGLIMGTLASAWGMYKDKYAVPAQSEPEQLPDQVEEDKPRAKGRRLRVFAGAR